jgi:hypothetical protein
MTRPVILPPVSRVTDSLVRSAPPGPVHRTLPSRPSVSYVKMPVVPLPAPAGYVTPVRRSAVS